MNNTSGSRTAILLVAFGSTLPHTREIYEHILATAHHRYGGAKVFLAYSSRMVLARLAQNGIPTPDVRGTIVQILQEGFTDLRLIPLFAIAGEDFHKWSSNIADLVLKFHSYTLGNPLLSNSARVEQVAHILLRSYPERLPGELLVLMGHGSPHQEGERFAEMARTLRHSDANTLFGCVEGHPDFATILDDLPKHQSRNILLAPFMMVTGDHAMNDMAGPDADSWKSQLEAKGYHVRCVQRGLLEIPAIVDLMLGAAL